MRRWLAAGARIALSAVGVALWRYGIQHWPGPPGVAYGTGFWAWASSFIVLLAAWSSPTRWRWPRWTANTWLAVGLVLIAGAMRFYRAETMPFGIHFDEDNAFNALEAMRTGTAENIFSRLDRYTTGNPGLVIALQWLFGFVSPNWFAATRYSSAAWGTLSIAATYLLARRLFSTRVAVAAGLFLTLSYWHLISSRMQFLNAPFGAALAWWMIVRACDSRRLVDAILAGMVGGLVLQLYDPIKILFVLVPIWWLWHAVVSRGFARQTALSMIVVGAVAWMALQPLLLRQGWEGYFQRVYTVTSLGTVVAPDVRPEGRPGLDQLRDHLAALARVATGGAELAANHSTGDPLLNWAEIVAVGLGLLLSVWRWRSWRHTIAPLWAVLAAIAVTLSSVPDASYRLAIGLPALAILAAIGVVTPLDWFARHTPRWLAWPVVGLVVVAVAAYDVDVNAVRTFRYFDKTIDTGEFTVLGRFIASGSTEPVYYIEALPVTMEHPVMLSLTHRRTVVNVANLVDQVPRRVDSQRPAVFVIPYWSSMHSLDYLRRVYPTAEVESLSSPSGKLGGYAVRVAPGHAASAAGCGLRRGPCDGTSAAVDGYLALLNVRDLCPHNPPQPIEWRGQITVPDGPAMEIGLTLDQVSARLQLDDNPPVPLAGHEAALPARVLPGTHRIAISANVLDGLPTTLTLWWRLPGQSLTVIPCQALTPNPSAT
ncbi:MAG TPA: glycosyltransferase family 39 protein [Candidatus Binatia bacterium]|nr:glycosyltransferase family 39 protein [Candidatus Binatia bacterium]